MPEPPIEIHPSALLEAQAAAAWYRERSYSAADAFLLELDRAMDMIASSPRRSPVFIGECRRLVLRRFPFSVVYREKSGTIQVVAIAHGKRKPGYWTNRV
jgi:plasmid stabilization system protein ParE